MTFYLLEVKSRYCNFSHNDIVELKKILKYSFSSVLNHLLTHFRMLKINDGNNNLNSRNYRQLLIGTPSGNPFNSHKIEVFFPHSPTNRK